MRLIWPLPSEHRTITTFYGEGGHNAVDIAAPQGCQIYACMAGVLTGEWTDKGGNVARITGADGWVSRYCHLAHPIAVEGAKVEPGDLVGRVGHTGSAWTGYHLHWETRGYGVAVNPMLYLKEEGRMSIGSYQFQGPAASWAKQHVLASGAAMIKQINPDYVEQWFSGEVIGRLWWDGEPDKQLVWQGAAGADAWWTLAHPRIATRPNIKLWEGPNEIAINSTSQAQQYNAFELRRIQILHANSLKAVSGCTSTGCWEPWVYANLFDVFNATDYWEVHEYGMHSMTLDGYNLLRYRNVITQLKTAGIRVPPFIVGETGIDFAGNPYTDGWKAQGLSPAQYAAQLNAYLLEVIKDTEVVCVTPFVWSAQGWPSFDMTEDVSGLYTNYVKNLETPPVDDLLVWAETIVIPYNPQAAIFRYIIGKGWTPQSQEMAHDGVPYMWGWRPNNTRTLCAWQSGQVAEIITKTN